MTTDSIPQESEVRELLEYPDRKVLVDQSEKVLDRCVNENKGLVKFAPRYGQREFNDPGKWPRRRLSRSALTPKKLARGAVRKFRNNEWWGCCTTPVNTGARLKNGKLPYRECQSFAVTPDGQLMEFQQLIDANPELVLGKEIAEKSRAQYGIATAMIVSKRFGNLDPIPNHTHFGGAQAKIEVHDIIGADCPGVVYPHSWTQAIGLLPSVDRDAFLRCMQKWGPKGNGVLDLVQWHKMEIGNGTFKCLPLMLHAPGAAMGEVVQHEVHNRFDQHGLYQDLMPACYLTPEQAFSYAPQYIREGCNSDYNNFEYWVDLLDFTLNTRTDIMDAFFSPNATAEDYSGDGVNAYWSCHGEITDGFETSILRLELKPGAKVVLRNLPSTGFVFLSKGQGRVAGVDMRMEYGLDFDGYIPSECGWMTQQLIDAGVEVENTGSKKLVLTMDFQKNKILSN